MSQTFFTPIIIKYDEPANDNEMGSLKVAGGVSINRNLIVGEEIVANELVTRGSVSIGGNLFTKGTVHLDGILEGNSDSIIVHGPLYPSIPMDLGQRDKRWDTIYSKGLETGHVNVVRLDAIVKASLGTNSSKMPLMKVGLDNPDEVSISGSLLLDGFYKMEPQYIVLDEPINNLLVNRSLVVFELRSGISTINLNLSALECNTIIRFSLAENYTDNGLRIEGGRLSILLEKDGDYFDALYNGTKLLFIGGNVDGV